MALNFPSNPVDGQTFGNYTYNSTKGVWSASATPPRYTVSPNIPASAGNGDVWFNSETARSYIYYVDADTAQWVEIGGTEGTQGVLPSLGDAPDVDVTGLADGDTLVYDSATSKWIPGEAGGKFTVSDTAPAGAENGDTWFKSDDGKTYIYYVDTDGGQWVEIASNTTGYLDIGQLNDVSIVSPTTGQALTFNGTNWVNATPASTLDSLTDVDTAGVADGQALVYDSANSEWVPENVNVYDVDNSSTGFFSMPRGTTGQRPVAPVDGFMRFNTELGEPEWYSADLDTWFAFRSLPTLAIDFELQYLVVAGGGGGGNGYGGYKEGGGGGGAGGYRVSYAGESSGGGGASESVIAITTGTSGATLGLTVGAGGAKAIDTPGNFGADGSNSVLSTITSIGGGGGAPHDTAGRPGGSGGGGGADGTDNNGAVGGAGTVNQGYSGGSGYFGSAAGAGGGGGASGVGSPGTSSASGGNGGPGLTTLIGPTSLSIAGGGGGGGYSGSGTGANGGGNGCIRSTSIAGTSASPNTGSGGGGGAQDVAPAGNGASGIVILRYPDTVAISHGVGLVSSTSTVGTDKVTTFTAGSGPITFEMA